MLTRVALFIPLSLLLPLAAAPKKKYDERGNPINATEKEAGKAVEPPTAPQPVSPASSAVNPPETTPATTAPNNVPEAAANASAEEAEALAQQRNPQTKVFLENAQLYLRSGRTDKALEFLKKSQEAGEDGFSREARLQSLWLRARRGDLALEAEAEGLDEKVRLPGLLRVADGYYACARELMNKKPDCLAEAERIYALIGETAPRAAEGKLARLRLGMLLVDQGRLEAALPILTQTLLNEPGLGARSAGEIPLDRAFYQLGQLYERPWYHQDVHKARAAYQQVLKIAGSPYQNAARERIASLERFGTGYTRP